MTPREGVDWVGALAHIAQQAFNGIGAANVAVHRRREGIKGQEMLFIDASAAHGFGIALLVFGECSRGIAFSFRETNGNHLCL